MSRAHHVFGVVFEHVALDVGAHASVQALRRFIGTFLSFDTFGSQTIVLRTECLALATGGPRTHVSLRRSTP